MSDSKVLVGKKIKEIRAKLQITQEAFSEMIGIETSSLSNIETGKSFPSMQTLINIVEKFSVDPQDFFNYSYLNTSQNLENEMIEIIKNQSYERKQILYRIIKQFAV
ncbi:helix-turn-helix transcriptional regulator [bacterium]|nr:helix-turn-helix transcriptional regulator [bacterium]